ncbi:MAG TPA: hypothetical protein VNA24_04445 [Hyalangium sp.]|nr:hypothetical protein [Hyalangium sp.]
MPSISFDYQRRRHTIRFNNADDNARALEELDNFRIVQDRLREDPRPRLLGYEVPRWGGIDVHIRWFTRVEAQLKRSMLQKAIETLAGDGQFALPQNRLDVFFMPHGTSMGYVARTTLGARRQAFLIYSDETPDVAREARSLENNAHGLTYLVGYAVYLYYRPSFTVNAYQAFVLTTLYHELGHILHHLESPTSFFVLRSINGLVGGMEEEQAGRHRIGSLIQTPYSQLRGFIDALEQVGYGVSTYASDKFIEYVSEVFSGLMMGVPFSDETITIYQALGGFLPDNNVRHRRTRNAFHEFLYGCRHTPQTRSFNRDRRLGPGTLRGLM